jgi:hypothetical protein
MIDQGQDTTRIHTKKKGGPPPHGGPAGKKAEGKREKGKEREGVFALFRKITDTTGLWTES